MPITLNCPICGTEQNVPHYLSGLRISCTICPAHVDVPRFPIDWLDGENPQPKSPMSHELQRELHTILHTWFAVVHIQIQDEIERNTGGQGVASRTRDAFAGLAWQGFTTQQDRLRRIGPVPVMVQVLCLEPHPQDVPRLRERFLRLWAVAFDEWRTNLRFLGDDLVLRW